MTDDLEDSYKFVNEDNPPASRIKAIDSGSVHRICSGQVVLTLATAVKELVENSVDAGATIVDIRLKEHGSELIEVSDNGSGVEEKDFEGLNLNISQIIYLIALKHHTSKIQDFSDVVNVETFGFRGEALSSLCALGLIIPLGITPKLFHAYGDSICLMHCIEIYTFAKEPPEEARDLLVLSAITSQLFHIHDESTLSITTCHSKANVGTKLEIDHNGKISQKSPQARQRGTTVLIQNLFYTLPVRHKEFLRNIKREFAKLIQVLNSYCIISTGVRITCTNQVGKGNRSTVVASNGNSSMKENIANVFGTKQMSNLVEFVKIQPTEEVLSEFNVKVTEETFQQFNIEGFVSKCVHGQGRGSSDRQFFFINKRPWDSTKVAKIVNEVYHQFNRHQYPFVSLHISMAKDLVDANVTPDKRQIFMQDEKVLLAIVKASLLKMYEPTVSFVQLNKISSSSSDNWLSKKWQGNILPGSGINFSPQSRSCKESNNDQPQSSLASCLGNLKRSFSSAFSRGDPSCSPDNKQRNTPSQPSKQRRLDHFISSATNVRENTENKISLSDDITYIEDDNSQDEVDSVIEPNSVHEGLTTLSPLCDDQSIKSENVITVPVLYNDNVGEMCNKTLKENTEVEESGISVCGSQDTVRISSQEEDSVQTDSTSFMSTKIEDSVVSASSIDMKGHIFIETERSNSGQCLEIEHNQEKEGYEFSFASDVKALVTQYDEKEETNKREATVAFNFEALKGKLKSRSELEATPGFCRSFRATINPSDNQAAEEELQREINKDAFAKMEILGQFNLGFIIVKLGEDLFIVDQHATDEKYNFEMLQRHTVIQNQKLIQPQNLELTASNETILMDNLEVFRKNGFEFLIDEEGFPTKRVKLTSIPVSKNWTFGKDDIEELIFMLSDSNGIMCRPSRVRQMFASRACRKSIMIGTALKKSEMKKLVHHMGEIEQPWNCPHGRPTMRHLININMVPR